MLLLAESECVFVQGVKDKEVIAAELAAAEGSLSATPRGAALMRKYMPCRFPPTSPTLPPHFASTLPLSCPDLLAAPLTTMNLCLMLSTCFVFCCIPECLEQDLCYRLTIVFLRICTDVCASAK